MQTNYCILLNSDAQNYPKQLHALNTCQKIIQSNHNIKLLFLQNDAVLLANAFVIIPDEEDNIFAEWHKFILENNITSKVCINSALKRGILDKKMATTYHKPAANLASMFTLDRLSTFFDTLDKTDNFLQL